MVKPEDVLTDRTNHAQFSGGVRGRKGSIAATLKNIQIFDQHLKKREEIVLPDMEQAIEDQKELLPVMRGVGIMELFSIEEWLQSEDALGRVFYALMYLEAFPEKISKPVIQRLSEILEWKNPILTKVCERLLSLQVCG